MIERAGCDTASLLFGDAGGEEKRAGEVGRRTAGIWRRRRRSPSLVDNGGAAANTALDEGERRVGSMAATGNYPKRSRQRPSQTHAQAQERWRETRYLQSDREYRMTPPLLEPIVDVAGGQAVQKTTPAARGRR